MASRNITEALIYRYGKAKIYTILQRLNRGMSAGWPGELGNYALGRIELKITRRP